MDNIFILHEDKVTPFVGAWIETAVLPHTPFVVRVTPFVGVWIETGELQAFFGGHLVIVSVKDIKLNVKKALGGKKLSFSVSVVEKITRIIENIWRYRIIILPQQKKNKMGKGKDCNILQATLVSFERYE